MFKIAVAIPTVLAAGLALFPVLSLVLAPGRRPDLMIAWREMLGLGALGAVSGILTLTARLTHRRLLAWSALICALGYLGWTFHPSIVLGTLQTHGPLSLLLTGLAVWNLVQLHRSSLASTPSRDFPLQ